MEHHDPKDRDGEKTGRPRDRVVNARCNPGAILRDGIHHRGGERSHANRHAQPENHDRREKICPVAAANVRDHEKHEADRSGQRTDNERKFCSVTYDKSARPTREKGNDQDKRQECRAGLGGGVVLDLNQIERQEKQSPAERGVEQKRQQVGASKDADAEKGERQHRLRNFLFY